MHPYASRPGTSQISLRPRRSSRARGAGGVDAAARFAVAERLQDGCGDEQGRRGVGEKQGGRGVSGVAAEEMVRGGEARQGCALDLGLPEGVAAEQQWRVIGGDEAWFRVGVRNPAVAPPGEGSLDDGGCEVGAEPVASARDHVLCNLRLVVLEVRAAPFWSGVDRDGRGFGDALAPVVADPVQRLGFDLHSSWLRY